MTECSDLFGLHGEYSYLTETISNSGDESFTQGGSESWLHQHAMKLEDMYYEELEKISESMESTFEMNEDEDWKEPENLEDMLFTDEKENHAMKTQDRPLYDSCPLTVGVSMLLIMTVAMRHGMTGEALQDILTLVSLHCISPNYCTESLRKFKQYFAIAKSPLVFHHYCSHCFLYLEDKRVETCLDTLCQKSLKGLRNKSFFIEIPIVSQLQDLFKQFSIWQMVRTYRFNRNRTNNDLGDIYDGALYRKHWESGFLKDYRNISFVYNTDGAPIFKSSKYSLWPLFLAINELPYSQRFSRNNMLLAGVWFGPDKPYMLTFLKPFHTVFHQLETNGVCILNPSGEEKTLPAILLCGTCDLPARCLVCNSIQFNEFYGCLRCRQPGKSVTTSKGGHVHVYPFNENDPCGPLRTKTGIMTDANQAVQQKSLVNGIKGPCWFAALQHHDIVLRTAIDYMHCALEGVMKLLLELWFTGKEGQEPFNNSDRVEEVDKHIKEIKPPNSISRCPRSIEGHRKYWKANELRAFLPFSYRAMVLRGILPNVFYKHFMLFSKAIFTLCLTNVTKSQIAHAERLLMHFCLTFEKLYGEQYQTANIHSLLHMAEDVGNLGPLWTHSTFPFESLNGEMLKLFHGTQNIAFQIISAININRALPTLTEALVEGSGAHRFYSKLISSSSPQNEMKISSNVFAVGKVTTKEISANVFEALSNLVGALPETTRCTFFFRAKIGQGMYHSLGYKRVYSRNSYTIQYEQLIGGQRVRKFGLISEYLQYQTPSSDSPECHGKCVCPFYNVAIVQTLEESKEPIIEDKITCGTASHVTITKRADKEKLVAIHLHQIIQKCVYMETSDFPDNAFIAVFPNMIEKD